MIIELLEKGLSVPLIKFDGFRQSGHLLLILAKCSIDFLSNRHNIKGLYQ